MKEKSVIYSQIKLAVTLSVKKNGTPSINMNNNEDSFPSLFKRLSRHTPIIQRWFFSRLAFNIDGTRQTLCLNLFSLEDAIP